jgi:DNA (cytosine-5)-methyltransferase 1
MVLRVGTDCSGIEAPIEALKQLKIPFEHEFSSEIDKYCIKSIKANYNPKIIFGDKDGPFPEGDIRKRDINVVPDIDLYVCGFPCQPFSSAGKRNGLNDDRGNVFFSCLDVIKQKQPKYFILENVKGLLTHDKGNTWKIISSCLENLKSNYGYYIHSKVLNTKDYGIPQNRERLFIIGNKNNTFIWGEKIKMKNLIDFIDFTDTRKDNIPNRIEKSNFLNLIPINSLIVDFSFYGRTTFPSSDKICPCIAKKSEMWNVKLNRKLNINELLKLQGFSINFNIKVPETYFKQQIGNSISVNVLKEILIKLMS